MKRVMGLAAAVAAVGVGWSGQVAADPPRATGGTTLEQVVESLDRNANGCIDREEGRNYTSRRFHALDTNGDSSIDAAEAPPGAEESTDARPVSLEQWQDAYRARFTEVDVDRSGCITLDELKTRPAAGGR